MRSGREEIAALLGGPPQLSVGVLSADQLSLGEELDLLADEGVRLAHVDIMDGAFCPPMTVGPAFVKALPATFVKDVHLMVADPLGKVDSHVAAGADLLTFHPEATVHPHRVLSRIGELDAGVARGVALNPGTPVAVIEPLLDRLELVLVLAVDPGWSGRSFLPSTIGRVAAVRELIGDRPIAVAVDGNITPANVGEVAATGANLIVAGTAIYDGDPRDNLETMRASISAA